MKLLLAFCLVVCVASPYSEGTPKHHINLKSITEKYLTCTKQNKIDLVTVGEYREKHNAFPNTQEVKCFLACIMKKDGMMTDDGKFTKSYKKVGESCINISGKDACEIAFKAIECLDKLHANGTTH